ncbi:MAG: discoidin domain-containing protein [Thermodesulfobacteriota bacterium]
MKRNWPKHLGIGLLFFLATLLMTFPLWIQMGSVINDTEDGLLNTWILSWDIEQIKNGNWRHFFDANIFFPHKKVLAYSEHLFSLALIALPVNVLFDNPILAYNAVLLFSFFMCGFAMYLLAFYFTSDHWASLVGGLIFAFVPFKFAHLCHIQVLFAWAIPLTFLAFHRLMSENRLRYLSGLIIFYLVQVLGNGYYALFLTFFLGLAFLYFLILNKRYRDRRLIRRLLIFVVISGVVAAPFFYPYFVVRKEMNFVRDEVFWADISSYLASGPLNWLYGTITAPFLRQEGELFPGLIALFLGFLGVRSLRGISGEKRGRVDRLWTFRRLNRIINVLILFLLGVSLMVVLTGGTSGTIWGIPYSAKTPRGFIFLIFMLFLIRLTYDRDLGRRLKQKFRGPGDTIFRFYYWMGLLAFLFTLGSEIHFFNIEVFPLAPYELLKRFVPGFDGLRVSSRFFIFVLLPLALFASLGFKTLKERMKGKGFRVVLAIVPLLLLLEYLAVPLPVYPVPVKDQVPPVYDWLKKYGGSSAVIELPLPQPWVNMAAVEAPRAYFSCYHWKRLFNGYSGFFPPVYFEMLYRMSEGVSRETIRDMQALGIGWLVFHSDQFEPGQARCLLAELKASPVLEWKAALENVQVFLIKPEQSGKGLESPSPARFLSVKGWEVKTSIGHEDAKKMIDGDKDTCWRTGRPQAEGDAILLDLEAPTKVKGISLDMGTWYFEYPRGVLLEGSLDGRIWFAMGREADYRPPLQVFLDPRAVSCSFFFSPVVTRYLRITTTRSGPKEWVVAEIRVLGSPD